jgi:hypothetical protein
MAKKQSETYLLCVDNTGYRAALEPRKLYRSLPDVAARTKGFVRVIDESGEDYLYPASKFVPVQLPHATKIALTKAS